MKQVQYPEIGLVTYKKNARSKRITLRVKTNGTVLITLSKYASYQEAERMLFNNLEWVKTQQLKLENSPQAQALQLDFNSTFQIRNKRLSVVPTSEINGKLIREENKIEIFVPTTWDIASESVQATLKKAVLDILKLEAKIYLPPRTIELAKTKGIAINDIRVKNIKSRWGSCSSRNNINLSLYLMLLTDELIDYVIMHELAHVKHKNHSAAFWQHLENLLPNALVLDKQMNQQRVPFLG